MYGVAIFEAAEIIVVMTTESDDTYYLFRICHKEVWQML